MLLYHLRLALRRLLGEPAFTLAAVLTLALGVGANVAVFTVVEAVLLRPLPYPEAERLVVLGHRDEPRADMYFPFERNPWGQVTLFVRTTGDPARPLASMRRAIRDLEPNITFLDTSSLAEIASESIRVTQLVLWLLGIFAATALALAVVGIYGVMSYVVRQRTREIGTRIALGAPRQSILWLVMREASAIAVLGAAIGIAAGLAASRLLGSMLYGTSPADPAVLAAAPLVLVAATLAACYLPARRAASVDPARTLAQG